jgi:phosphocarrier protein HPr
MAQGDVTLNNDVGLHARPAAVFSKAAAGYSCNITVIKDGNEANAKSIMSVLKLDVRKGDVITLKTEGEGADEALSELVDMIESM